MMSAFAQLRVDEHEPVRTCLTARGDVEVWVVSVPVNPSDRAEQAWTVMASAHGIAEGVPWRAAPVALPPLSWREVVQGACADPEDTLACTSIGMRGLTEELRDLVASMEEAVSPYILDHSVGPDTVDIVVRQPSPGVFVVVNLVSFAGADADRRLAPGWGRPDALLLDWARNMCPDAGPVAAKAVFGGRAIGVTGVSIPIADPTDALCRMFL
jgi:hypothetical protein